MEFISIPVIVVICYIVGEIYKVLFKNKKDLYKLIPIFLSILGGVIGVLIYYTDKEMILNVSNVYEAIFIGIVSGAVSTGSNQIIKQIFKKEVSIDLKEEK